METMEMLIAFILFVSSALLARVAAHRAHRGSLVFEIGAGVLAGAFLVSGAGSIWAGLILAAALVGGWVTVAGLYRRAERPAVATDAIERVGLLDVDGARDADDGQYFVGQLDRSVVVHTTSLGIDDDTRLHATGRGWLLLVTDAARRVGAAATELATRRMLERAGTWGLRSRIRSAIGAARSVTGTDAAMTIACTRWPFLYVGGIGDARAYRLRGSVLERLRARGKVSRYRVAIGDTLLLCTDDLVRRLGEERIRSTLQRSRTAQAACRRLRDAAGGSVVIVARVCSRDGIEPVAARLSPPRPAGAPARVEQEKQEKQSGPRHQCRSPRRQPVDPARLARGAGQSG